MLIRVIYHDGRFDFVKPYMLDRLIDEKKLDRFQRKSGWASVGVDPIRKNGGEDYAGPDRRFHESLS